MRPIVILVIFMLILVEIECRIYDPYRNLSSKEMWAQYKKDNGKAYKNAEEDELRYKLWMDNYYYVKYHNNKVARKKGYFIAMNNDCDRTKEELARTKYGLKLNSITKQQMKLQTSGRRIFNLFSKPALPDHINWAEKGFVSSVKDQGTCGACWSFVTTGALESHMMIKYTKNNTYSEQNLMDCSVSYGNEGCEGGLMSQAYDYIIDNGGLVSDRDYQYTGKLATCQYPDLKTLKIPVQVSHYKSLPISEEVLKKYVALKGPIAVGIDGNHKSFIFYKSGIYYEPKCSSIDLNHAILVVGYGTDEKSGQDYWLIKNSWGTKWGENGYGKIARNRQNHCGIASLAGYPVLK